MADSPLKKLAAAIGQGGKPKKASKANRTLYLAEPQFTVFAKYLRSKDESPSETVDKLISMFLDEVKHELPPGVTWNKDAS